MALKNTQKRCLDVKWNPVFMRWRLNTWWPVFFFVFFLKCPTPAALHYVSIIIVNMKWCSLRRPPSPSCSAHRQSGSLSDGKLLFHFKKKASRVSHDGKNHIRHAHERDKTARYWNTASRKQQRVLNTRWHVIFLTTASPTAMTSCVKNHGNNRCAPLTFRSLNHLWILRLKIKEQVLCRLTRP